MNRLIAVILQALPCIKFGTGSQRPRTGVNCCRFDRSNHCHLHLWLSGHWNRRFGRNRF